MRKTVLRRLGHFRSIVLRPIWAWLIAGLLSFVSLLAFARDEFLAPDIAQQYRLLRWAPSWPWYWWALAFAGTILCVVFEGSFRSAERQRRRIDELEALATPRLRCSFGENIPGCVVETALDIRLPSGEQIRLGAIYYRIKVESVYASPSYSSNQTVTDTLRSSSQYAHTLPSAG